MQSEKIEVLWSVPKNPPFEIISIGKYRLGLFLDQNRFEGSNNQDRLFLVADGERLVFGVADGAGGHPQGDRAAELVADKMLKVPENIVSWIEEINQEIVDFKVGARTTLACAEILGDGVRFYSVGDSEILLWNATGNELFASFPDSPTGHKVAAGVLSQADALEDKERHFVDNLMGEKVFQIHSTSTFSLKKGHTIIIGSDGLFDNVLHKELQEKMATGTFETSFQSLCDILTSRNNGEWRKEDDISVIVLRKIEA